MRQIIDTRILSDLIYRKLMASIITNEVASESVSNENVSKMVTSILSDMEINFGDLKASLESTNPNSEAYAIKSALIDTVEDIAANYAFEHAYIETDDPVQGYEIAAEAATKEAKQSGVDAVIADMLKFKDNTDVQYAAKFILGIIKDTQDDKMKNDLDEEKLNDEDADEESSDDDNAFADDEAGDNGGNGEGNDGDQNQGNNEQNNNDSGNGNGNGTNNTNDGSSDNNTNNNDSENDSNREQNPFA